MNASHLVINSNKWFSAVSDYSLQLTRFLQLTQPNSVVFSGHSTSPLKEKVAAIGVPFLVLPLLPASVFSFFRSWFCLTQLLTHSVSKNAVVWTFEGREHSLCALHRFVHRKLWQEKTLVRIRGQAQILKSSATTKWIYSRATDKIVFAASAIARAVPIYFPASRAKVQLYCRSDEKTVTLTSFQKYEFLKDVPPIDFQNTVFLVVGRYDPVKGHTKLIDALSAARFESDAGKPVQFVFVGESQNVNAKDLFDYAKQKLGQGVSQGRRYYASNAAQTVRLYIFDERVTEVPDFMANSHFGIIPSLGSEVICRVAVEFLQRGTPVIASQAGALQEVLAGTPGRIFSLEKSDDLVSALVWANEVASDSSRHEKFRVSSREIGVSRFDLSQFSGLVAWVQSKR